MYKLKLAATYHCNKKHHRKRWQWKNHLHHGACFAHRWSSVPQERDKLFGKRPLSNIKITVSTIWLKRFPSCKESFERFSKYQRLLKRGRKKASEFVLLRKRIKVSLASWDGRFKLEWSYTMFSRKSSPSL